MIARLIFICLVTVFTGSTHAVTHFDMMLALGDSSIAIEWTPDSTNTRIAWYQQYGSGCTGADSIYRHCDFTPGETYRSIAYSYGGEDGYPLFREKVATGFLVGSHMCHYKNFGDPSNIVAGTDCSGFICYLWGVPRVETQRLYSQYTAITREEITAGDILVKPGSHAVLVVEREDATHFIIWESTSVGNCCRERSIDIADSYWDAYFPRRFDGLMMQTATTRPTSATSGYPMIQCHNGALFIEASQTWSGSVELYTPMGQVVYSKQISLSDKSRHPVSVPASAGVLLARFSKSTTEQCIVKITVTRR